MKKALLICIMMFYSMWGMAQSVPSNVPAKNTSEEVDFEDEFFSLLDMKIFHDREIVQNMIGQLYNQQSSDVERENLTQGIFNEKDSAILEKALDSKQIKYQIAPELLKKASETPFEAFKDVVRNASVPELTKEEMAELWQVDEKAIPRMMQMVTESGPDIGTRRVSVIYDDEAQN